MQAEYYNDLLRTNYVRRLPFFEGVPVKLVKVNVIVLNLILQFRLSIFPLFSHSLCVRLCCSPAAAAATGLGFSRA